MHLVMEVVCFYCNVIEKKEKRQNQLYYFCLRQHSELYFTLTLTIRLIKKYDFQKFFFEFLICWSL